jgi:hypothetical protein
LKLLKAGFWVIAIYPRGARIKTRDDEKIAGGKEPIGPAWGVERRTEEWIRRKFAEHPDAGIGILFGPKRAPGGAWLIECEGDGPQAAESLAKFLGGEDVDTPQWRATRGEHAVFTADGDRLLNLLAAAGAKEGTGIKAGVWHLPELPGLEIRVGGLKPDGSVKQVQSVVPPTPGTDGKPREWIRSPRGGVAPLPEAAYAMLERIAASKASKATPPFANSKGASQRRNGAKGSDAEARAVAYLATIDPAISGQKGHSKTFRAACQIGPGFDLPPDVAFRILADHYNPRCQPPWSDAELRHKVEDAYSKESRRGWLLEAPPRITAPSPSRNGSGGDDGSPHGDNGRERPQFSNSTSGEEDKPVPILMPSLIDSLASVGKGWPKRIGETLFVASADFKPVYLESSTQFMGWLDGRASVYWSRGPGMISQERLYEYVRKFHAEQFDAVESYPHEPPMKGNFYLHPHVRPRRSYDLTERFLGFFSPATDADRELIRAAILTPFWGGTPGARPAFRFDGPEDDPPELGGRGVGKTKSVELIAAPCGGLVDLRENENISDLITRLLSEEGQSKRILRIDNVKTLRLSWADLEALITTKELSGKRLYRGEGRRPNVLTTFITVNGGSLSKDMALRQITIRLARPDPKGTWLRDAFAFVEEHRWELIGELLGALSDEPGDIRPASRWDEWEKEVLSRVSRWDECQAIIAKRAKELDADEEDAHECEEFFAVKLAEKGHNPLIQIIKIPMPVAAEWLSEYETKPVTPGNVSRQLKRKPLKRLRWGKEEERRFWLWIGPQADATLKPVELGHPATASPF